MTTMTREEQKQVLIDTANHVINRDNTSPYSENLRELARIALASLEAEPIGAFHIAEQQVDGTSDYIKDGEWPIDNGTIEVYAAPPVPVVPAALPENDDEDGHDIDYLEPSEVYSLGRTAGWNACRAAMLHGAEPASNHEELPLDYLQGQKDGLEWAAQLAEANHPQTGDWLYDDPVELAKAIRKGPDMPEAAGNYPVTPDGWISCSERMPEDTKMLLAFSQGEIVAAYWNWVVNPIDYKKYRAFTYLSGNILDDVTHWMPLPEPPL
ncbi:TPA: DUF551 domain-containing protein [Escherichia coli]